MPEGATREQLLCAYVEALVMTAIVHDSTRSPYRVGEISPADIPKPACTQTELDLIQIDLVRKRRLSFENGVLLPSCHIDEDHDRAAASAAVERSGAHLSDVPAA